MLIWYMAMITSRGIKVILKSKISSFFWMVIVILSELYNIALLCYGNEFIVLAISRLKPVVTLVIPATTDS